MSKGFEGRLIRLEQFHRNALGKGCATCRDWGNTVHIFDDREDPPAICPICQRDRPVTLLWRTYVGLNFDFDAVEAPNDQIDREPIAIA